MVTKVYSRREPEATEEERHEMKQVRKENKVTRWGIWPHRPGYTCEPMSARKRRRIRQAESIERRTIVGKAGMSHQGAPPPSRWDWWFSSSRSRSSLGSSITGETWLSVALEGNVNDDVAPSSLIGELMISSRDGIGRLFQCPSEKKRRTKDKQRPCR